MQTKVKITILCLVGVLTALVLKDINTHKIIKKEVPTAKAIEVPVVGVTEEIEYIPVAERFVDETVTVMEGVIEETPTYYVEVKNCYITEDSLKSICQHIGNAYGIDPKLLQAIAWQESRYKVNAVGGSNDSGLCQIVPRWHGDRMKKLGITDIFDPYSNVLLCADILDELKNHKYGDDIIFVLMAYNMGAYGATKPYESGVISSYATDVLNKFYELNSK